MADRTQLVVGFSYNEKRGVSESEAEFDSPTTLQAIRNAIRKLGHQVVDLEALPSLPKILTENPVDVVFNIAEGMHGRNREVQVPALLELVGIPYTGSDPTTLAITLDKGLAKRIITSQGLATAAFQVFTEAKTCAEELREDLQFPLILKPVAEGSSKGIVQDGVVYDLNQFQSMCALLIEKHKQPVIAEEFLVGREFTVGILGSPKNPKILPPMEIVFAPEVGPYPVYSYKHKQVRNEEVRNDPHPVLDADLRQKIESLAAAAYAALGCRDVARMDIRLDAHQNPCFIECNPLPGLSPGWSDLCLIADGMQLSYEELIASILKPAIERLSERQAVAQFEQNESQPVSTYVAY